MIKNEQIQYDIDIVMSQLIKALQQDKDILFAYLFGSYGKGKPNSLSDIDLAVYFKNRDHLTDKKIHLFLLVSKILKTDEIDIVLLNESTPLLVHSIMQTGKLLFSKDELERIRFLSKNLKEYLEMEYYRERYQDAMKKRIKERNFGF
jgi:hypothetical protein